MELFVINWMTTTIISFTDGHYCSTEQYIMEKEDDSTEKNGKIVDVNLATAQAETK